MPATYSWLEFVNAKAELAARLADPQNLKWTDAENGLYIQMALRMWNSLTLTWKQDSILGPGSPWINLGLAAGSSRLRTVTDIQCYTLMEYMLTEPPTGGTWTGTSMFTMSDLSGALQRRRDEMLQLSNCNEQILPLIAGQPLQSRYELSDNVLEPQRIRWLSVNPATGQPNPAHTLFRDDSLAVQFFDPNFTTAPPGEPNVWMVSIDPPLSFDTDNAPALEGNFEVLALVSGATFNPPSVTLLGIPDDFSIVAIFGALADLLGRDSESTDRTRAAWCQSRYEDWVKVLVKTPWIFSASLNGIPSDLPGMTTMDRYSPEWDSNASFGSVVLAGVDFIWIPSTQSAKLTLLANAPIPINNTDYVQCSRSNWDAVLSMAQFLATFKLGGAEFTSAQELEKIFMTAAAVQNKQLADLGAFSDLIDTRADAELRMQERN